MDKSDPYGGSAVLKNWIERLHGTLSKSKKDAEFENTIGQSGRRLLKDFAAPDQGTRKTVSRDFPQRRFQESSVNFENPGAKFYY